MKWAPLLPCPIDRGSISSRLDRDSTSPGARAFSVGSKGRLPVRCGAKLVRV